MVDLRQLYFLIYQPFANLHRPAVVAHFTVASAMAARSEETMALRMAVKYGLPAMARPQDAGEWVVAWGLLGKASVSNVPILFNMLQLLFKSQG